MDVVLTPCNLAELGPGTNQGKSFTTTSDGRVMIRYAITANPESYLSVWVDGKVAFVHEHGATKIRHEPDIANVERILYLDLPAGAHTVKFTSSGKATTAGTAVAWIGGLAVAVTDARSPVFFAAPSFGGAMPSGAEWTQDFTLPAAGLVSFTVNCGPVPGTDLRLSVDGVGLVEIRDASEADVHQARTAVMFLAAGSHHLVAHNDGAALYFQSLIAGYAGAGTVISPGADPGTLAPDAVYTKGFTTTSNGLVAVRYGLASAAKCLVGLAVDGVTVNVHDHLFSKSEPDATTRECAAHPAAHGRRAHPDLHQHRYRRRPHRRPRPRLPARARQPTAQAQTAPRPADDQGERPRQPLAPRARVAHLHRHRRRGRHCRQDRVPHRRRRLEDRHQLPRRRPADHSGDGVHRVEYRSTDSFGRTEKAKWCEVKIDTRRPRTTAPSAASVARGKTAILAFRVWDARPNGNTATVTIKVRDAAGTLVKTLRLRGQSLRTTLEAAFTCGLPGGRTASGSTPRTPPATGRASWGATR